MQSCHVKNHKHKWKKGLSFGVVNRAGYFTTKLCSRFRNRCMQKIKRRETHLKYVERGVKPLDRKRKECLIEVNSIKPLIKGSKN